MPSLLYIGSRLSSALADNCANIGDTSCALSAAQGANTAQQLMTHPLPVGNSSSGAYKWGFYTGPILVGAMLGLRGALARTAAEDGLTVFEQGAAKVPVEHAMRPPVEFPEMRDQVIASLQSLADPYHQEVRWGRYEEGVNYYDDLTLNVHVLYDDCQVLPDPSRSVGAVLYGDEVEALRGLHVALGPMLDELQDSSDSNYLADPRWPGVVSAAREALDVMRSSEF